MALFLRLVADGSSIGSGVADHPSAWYRSCRSAVGGIWAPILGRPGPLISGSHCRLLACFLYSDLLKGRHCVCSGIVVLQGPTSLVDGSGPPFSEPFFCCSFHMPARPTSPFDFCGRQTLIRKGFVLIVRAAKPDGASRTSIHLELPI